MNARGFNHGILAAFLIFSLATSAQAKEKKNAGAEAAAQKAAERAAREAAVKTDLNGTVWSVEFTPLSGEKPKKPKKDTLSFAEAKISSEQLVKEGYLGTNYTLTVADDPLAPVVWETMQTKEGAGVAFWRGERQGDTMRGILSRRSEEGAVEDFSFSGSLKERKVAEPAAAPAPAPAAKETVKQAAPAAAAPKQETKPSAAGPQSKEPKKEEPKKKGWW